MFFCLKVYLLSVIPLSNCQRASILIPIFIKTVNVIYLSLLSWSWARLINILSNDDMTHLSPGIESVKLSNRSVNSSLCLAALWSFSNHTYVGVSAAAE